MKIQDVERKENQDHRQAIIEEPLFALMRILHQIIEAYAEKHASHDDSKIMMGECQKALEKIRFHHPIIP